MTGISVVTRNTIHTIAYPTQQSSSPSRVIYPILTNKEMTTESQRYSCFIRNGGNAIPKHAGPEAKSSSPTTGLTLVWARNPFRGNFNYWQVSRKEAGQNYSPAGRMYHGRPLKIRETGPCQQVAQLHERYMMMMMMVISYGLTCIVCS